MLVLHTGHKAAAWICRVTINIEQVPLRQALSTTEGEPACPQYSHARTATGSVKGYNDTLCIQMATHRSPYACQHKCLQAYQHNRVHPGLLLWQHWLPGGFPRVFYPALFLRLYPGGHCYLYRGGHAMCNLPPFPKGLLLPACASSCQASLSISFKCVAAQESSLLQGPCCLQRCVCWAA